MVLLKLLSLTIFYFHFLGSWAILPIWGPHKWKFNWFWHNTNRRKTWYVSNDVLCFSFFFFCVKMSFVISWLIAYFCFFARYRKASCLGWKSSWFYS